MRNGTPAQAPSGPMAKTVCWKSSSGWDQKEEKQINELKSSQASGKVKEARVIAVTYLGGKMFAHVPSVLLSDALGHEIVPLYT